MVNTKQKILTILFLIFALAFAVRTLPTLMPTFASGRAIFHDTDPYYHMRRVVNMLNNKFKMIGFDYYLNYPQGGVSFWPSGYDKLLAGFIWVVNAGKLTKQSMELTACWFPPLLGAATIFIIFLIGRTLFSDSVGLLAAFLLALQPMHIGYTELGKIDQHSAEPFFAFLMYYFFIRILKSQRSNVKCLTGSPYFWSVLTGIGIWLAYMMWSGTTLYIIPLFAAMYLLLFHFSKEDMPRYINCCIITTLTALVLLLYPCLTSWWGKRLLFAHDGLSLFQISLLTGILLFFALHKAVIHLIRPAKAKIATVLFTIVFLFSGIFIFKIFAPQIFKVITEGLALLAKKGDASYHVWLTTIAEYVPLVFIDGRFIWRRAVYSLSWGIFLIPLGILFMFTTQVNKAAAILVTLVTVFLGLLAFQQSRYCYIFGLNVALLSAFAIFVIYDFLKTKKPVVIKLSAGFENWLEKLKSRFPFRKWPHFGIDTVFLIFILFMLLKHSQMLSASLFSQPHGPILTFADCETLEWLRDNTPVTSGYDKPVEKPEYGIMNVWDWGHFIEYIAERPAAVNPYGMGIDKMVNFYLAKTEEEANKVMEENNCRYVLTSDPLPIVESLRQISLKYPDETYKLLQFEGPMLKVPKSEFLQLMGIKLHLHDGAKPFVPDMEVEGLSRYRLVYESPEGSEIQYMGGPVNTSKLKLFEHIKGAVFRGKTKPETDIEVSLKIQTNIGRQFLYRNVFKAGLDGRYELILPYSTEGNNYPVLAQEDYEIKAGKKTFKLKVNEEDVINGKIIS
ncbi:MAG: STT3 domain-containing protein [bacterium]